MCIHACIRRNAQPLHTCMHTCMHTYIHTCIHTCIHAHTRIHAVGASFVAGPWMHIQKCTYMHTPVLLLRAATLPDKSRESVRFRMHTETKITSKKTRNRLARHLSETHASALCKQHLRAMVQKAKEKRRRQEQRQHAGCWHHWHRPLRRSQ